MAIPQNSYSKEFQRNLREARQEAQRQREESRVKLDRDNAPQRRASRKEQIKKLFDALEVGSSLQFWGIDGTVAKKNKKSIVTNMGNKYTLKELGGE